jgi:hypothetical protein
MQDLNKGVKMEKIVILLDKERDENLLKCLKALFPECTIEVHEKTCRRVSKDELIPPLTEDDLINEGLDKYLCLS